jgi:hypothetical protein
MKLDWQGNTRITVGGTSKTPQGNPPALHLFQSNLYLVYIGQSGSNIYYSWLSPGNLASEWQGNIKITTINGTPKSSNAPALCVVAGILHMVYSGEDGDSLWWSWFDGSSWHGNIELFNPTGGPRPIPKAEPALAVKIEGDTLHLVYTKGGDLYYSSCNVGNPDPASPWVAANWQTPTLAVSADTASFASPTLAPLASGFALAARVGAQLFVGIGAPGAWDLKPITSSQAGAAPIATAGPTMVAWDNVLYVIYLGQSQKYLWWCALDASGAFQGNWRIVANSTPEGQSRPAAAVFDQQLCIAYTGSGYHSDNLYFAYTDNLPPLTIPIIGPVPRS